MKKGIFCEIQDQNQEIPIEKETKEKKNTKDKTPFLIDFLKNTYKLLAEEMKNNERTIVTDVDVKNAIEIMKKKGKNEDEMDRLD